MAEESVILFERFFKRWMESQEEYVEELLRTERSYTNGGAGGDKVVTDLVSHLLAHYQLYYEEKSRAVEKNVFAVLSPPWLTPLERTFLWVGGFKSALAFRIVDHIAGDQLSDMQRRRMNELQEATRTEERALSDELARIQESVAAPPLMDLARIAANRRTTTTLLTSALVTVVRNADLLRTTTALKVVEILTPLQSLTFFRAVGRLHLKIRTWGFQRNTLQAVVCYESHSIKSSFYLSFPFLQERFWSTGGSLTLYY